MIDYLLARPELSFSPEETSEMCLVFDGALAQIQDHNSDATWTGREARAAIAARIVQEWQGGERDRKALTDRIVAAAKTIAAEAGSDGDATT